MSCLPPACLPACLQKPVDPSVWVALLAAPLVAERCAQLTKQHAEQQDDNQQLHAGAEEPSGSSSGGSGSAAATAPAPAAPSDFDMQQWPSLAEHRRRQQEAAAAAAAAAGRPRGWVNREQQHKEVYLQQYAEAVSDVLDGMLQVRRGGVWCAAWNAAGVVKPVARQSGRPSAIAAWFQIRPGWGCRGLGGCLSFAALLGSATRLLGIHSLTMHLHLRARPAQALDAASMRQLGRQAQKLGKQLAAQSGGGRRSAAGQGSSATLLPCVLSRPAVERAAALLHLEAELRGRPELAVLLERSEWPHRQGSGATAGDAADAADGQQYRPGRHNEQHMLWQRLERAAALGGGASNGDAAASPGAAAPPFGEAEGDAAVRKQRRQRRQGRHLSAEERLVLGILSDPRFDYASRTALPAQDPSA